MKVGAERKKVAILVGLLLVAVVVYFVNSSGTGDPSAGSTSTARNTPVTPPPSAAAPQAAVPQRPARAIRSGQEFRPSLATKRGEQRPDPMSIDPTLKLDLLAKLQTINVEGSHRSIFDFAQPPAEKPEPVKAAAKPVPSPIVPIKDDPVKAAADAEAAKPKAPPIPLKFYGYVNPAGQPVKRAFFMEGEDIHVVTEGEVVKKRYKIVRIGVNSVVVEDTQFGSEQTLPLEEQQG